jgi:hypothetical protein
VYTNAFNDTIKQRQDIEFDHGKTITDDATTVTDVDSDQTINSSNTKGDTLPTPKIAKRKYAPLSNLFENALRNLHVENTYGVCLKSYSAQSPDQLSFTNLGWINSLHKVDEQWYFGTIWPSETELQSAGIISRGNILVCHLLNVPLRIQTSRGSEGDSRLKGGLHYNKGDLLEIMVTARKPYL